MTNWCIRIVVTALLGLSYLSAQETIISDVMPKARFRSIPALRASGSSQFSAEQLREYKQRIKAPKLMVIDLRRESHGFIDGTPISWYKKHNTSNAGRTTCQVMLDETLRLKAALGAHYVPVYNLIKQDRKTGAVKLEYKRNMAVLQSLSEAELCALYNIDYRRLPTGESHAPLPHEVDAFVALMRELDQTVWKHFHCRAGCGRTTLFLAMYDIMIKGDRQSLETIVRRQKALGGVNLLRARHKRHWKYPFIAKRAAFIKRFYNYCAQQRCYKYKVPWSQWLAHSTNR